ncbi:MAG: hypothetical protein DRQ88_09440 [Epsilonproteobacteria bacterium]|nr:MAG: hypothetical protein DRQ89_10160 [Campylobacterota bacterium]RLA65343.1 MAG: hypothetical protein DRQ88_09440 [Campylobacterota bacterium]
MIDTSIQVKTDQFDGPLGLLLLLVQKEDMDIRSLDIGPLSEQYLDYLEGMKNLDFDVAGDYLYLLATLVYLKSQSALDEESSIDLPEVFDEGLGITSKADLIRRLEELQKFQALGQKLWDLPKLNHIIFTKPKVNKKAIIDSILTPLEVDEITGSMMDLIKRNNRKFSIIEGDKISLDDRLKAIKPILPLNAKVEFEVLLRTGGDRDCPINMVVTFICILELARLKRIEVFQNEPKAPIYVVVVKSLDGIEEFFTAGEETAKDMIHFLAEEPKMMQ